MRMPLFFFCAALALLTSACSGNNAWRAVGPAAVEAKPVLAEPEGLNFTPLFAEKIGNPDKRFQRLEDAVQSVRNDLDSILPMKLGAAEAEPVPVPPGMAPPPPSPPPTAAVAMAGDVTGVRIADHADKTRVVLDMTASPDTTARIERKGRMLVIPLSNMNWKGRESWEADSAQLVSGYHLEKGILYVDLMYAAQIKTMDVLPPTGQNKNYRLLVDLFSPELHK
ncbi:MAG: hypothetical protein K8R48_05055 [Alphaproteobacteria bacterium]|nr:hypothetical protein [Alphaproteobacteria bacterium]